MDPITQATLGAMASVAVLGRRTPLAPSTVAWIGALGGAAADLDILIRSSEDPLLNIEYHRHFTHSLGFVPVGGVLSALPWLTWKRTRECFRWVLAASTLGYATHALLDACTTYGTLLFWPLSMSRVSFRIISVIDPLFTLPLVALLLASVRRALPRLAGVAWLYAFTYLGIGVLQHQRASAAQKRVAESRGHPVERGHVFPTFMNNTTWRSVYRAEGRYHIDKIRVTWTLSSCVTPGTQVPVLENPLLGAGAGSVHPKSQRAHRLIRWFADDWVALDPSDTAVIGDLRYSFSPVEASPIWGVKVDDDLGKVEWINNRAKREIHLSDLVDLVFRDGPAARCD